MGRFVDVNIEEFEQSVFLTTKMKALLIICVFSVFLVLCPATSELSLSSQSSPTEDEESSSSGSSSSFQVKVEEHETSTDSKGTYQITKVFERKKTEGGNETSSSRTVEVFRFPNGTIQRKVKNNGPSMKAECATKKDCPANKFCNKLTYQCQDCIRDFGCFNNEQCCDGKVCSFGKCEAKREYTGLVHSSCRSSKDCKAELYCRYSMFYGGVCMKRKTEDHSCNNGMFPDQRVCADGLECKRVGGFPFFNYKCMKKGSMQDKSNWADSPFGWFDADALFDDQK